MDNSGESLSGANSPGQECADSMAAERPCRDLMIAALQSAAKRASPPDSDVSGRRILPDEDNPINQKPGVRILEKKGREGSLSGAEKAYERLETAQGRLSRAMETVRKEGST